RDRALKIFLFLLDPEEPEDELIEYAECVNDLILEFNILEFLERRLLSSTLPESTNIKRIQSACISTNKTAELFNKILTLQADVKKVSTAFDSIHLSAFLDKHERSSFRQALIDDGSLREIVLAISQ